MLRPDFFDNRPLVSRNCFFTGYRKFTKHPLAWHVGLRKAVLELGLRSGSMGLDSRTEISITVHNSISTASTPSCDHPCSGGHCPGCCRLPTSRWSWSRMAAVDALSPRDHHCDGSLATRPPHLLPAALWLPSSAPEPPWVVAAAVLRPTLHH